MTDKTVYILGAGFESMNGLERLIKLTGTEDDFIKHFFEATMFFEPEDVKSRAKYLLEEIAQNNKIPVRYSLKLKNKFSSKDAYVGSVKNRKQAREFSRKNDLIHKERNVKVFCDTNGNKSVVDCIRDYTGFSVSTNKSDYINYTISHIWAKTDDPFFFTSLWNVAIVPSYLSSILDKQNKQHVINRKIQSIIKAICIELYNPNDLMNQNLVKNESEEYKEIAKKIIKEKVFTFIGRKDTTKKIREFKIENKGVPSVDTKICNKDYIINLLEKLKAKSNSDNIFKLTSAIQCKELFNLAFPLLKLDKSTDSQYLDEAGSQRYYKQNTYFEFNDIKYIICNHWFPIQRDLFELWVDNI